MMFHEIISTSAALAGIAMILMASSSLKQYLKRLALNK